MKNPWPHFVFQVFPGVAWGFFVTSFVFGFVVAESAEISPDEKLRQLLKRAEAGEIDFLSEVAPVLEARCTECHDDINEEGDLDLTWFLTPGNEKQSPDVWTRISQYAEADLMPPAKKKSRLAEPERRLISAWAYHVNRQWDLGKMGRSPGENPVRRLNRNEYAYTIRDLFGIEGSVARDFPADATGRDGFDNTASALFLSDLLMENYVETTYRLADYILNDPERKKAFLREWPADATGAEALLAHWAPLFYRRPASREELQRLLRLYRFARAGGSGHVKALRDPLLAMLLSPKFLYRTEAPLPELESERTKKDHRRHFELANRLSYFLWSSMPDETLFELAGRSELSKPDILKGQVLRMLRDEKAKALAMHFAGRWLGWEKLREEANPDPTTFPGFTFSLRVDFYKESRFFFENLIRTNRSAYELIDSDYSFLNEALAKHYGIGKIKGSHFRRVSFQNNGDRGGVLGMASVLTATSRPARTSPSIRGSFILERLLGQPPLAPPMDEPGLPEESNNNGAPAESFSESLKRHRNQAECRTCHEQIDPLGVALEGFDAIGRRRIVLNGADSAKLPGGETFSGLSGLKGELLRQKESFARTFVEHLFSYALGRELTAWDRPSIYETTQAALRDECRMHTVILGIVNSEQFMAPIELKGSKKQPALQR